MGIKWSTHAKERTVERHCPPYMVRKAIAAAQRSGDGNYVLPTGHTVVVRGDTVTTVLAPGMERDERLSSFRA
jgi:hypothetical protein